MIELTREEAVSLLKVLSQVDGFLLGVDGSKAASDLMDYPVDLICKKLEEDK